ncbi:hypothetical protein EIP86_009917 [Pleurotus ostreatoroseus]|nr:hypothetical protein EIP86_009917 [Pleurotus ostreatoroseus]
MQAPSSRLSVSEWISILVELPLLEKLFLSQVLLPERPEVTQRSASSAHLPHLTDMSIFGDMFTAQSSLLRRISPAANVRISFTCAGLPEAVELPVMVQLLDALGDKFIHSRYKTAFTHPSSIHLSASYKDHRETMMVTLSAPSQEFLDTCDCQLNAKLILCIGFYELPLHPDVHPKLCRAVCEMISKTFLQNEMRAFRLSSQYNHFEDRNAVVPEGCKELFSQMPNISDLSLSSEYIHAVLLQALQVSTAQAPNGCTETTLSVPFPSLGHLTLHQRSNTEDLNLDLVRRLLLSRQELGLPISHVRVHRDVADYSESEALRTSLLPLATRGCYVDVCKAEWQNLVYKRENIRVF